MKVLMLADPYEPHIIKWVSALGRQGLEIILFSLVPGDPALYTTDQPVTFYHCGFSDKLITGRPGKLSKMLYLRALPQLRRVIREHQPDVLHAHYASGYGLIGALSGFQPFLLSAWGSDVVHFPTISPIHRCMIRFVLKKARKVLSTSRFMTGYIERLAGVQAEIIPFGIDTRVFYPMNHQKNEHTLVIGTIKKMKPEYSLHTLVNAFELVREMLPGEPLHLMLVGDGKERARLEEMVRSKGLEPFVEFCGYQPYARVARYHNRLDIYVNVSLEESFGVSVLEASACGRPVVASDVGGLPEVVRQGYTGYLVEPDNSRATAQAVYQLIKDPALRKKMGAQGREWVQHQYSLDSSVEKMVSVYRRLIDSRCNNDPPSQNLKSD